MIAGKKKLHENSREIFLAALAAYLLMILAEALKSGYVSNFFNIHILLVAVILSGITMVLSDVDKSMLRSAQRLFEFPTEEISWLASNAKKPESVHRAAMDTSPYSRSAARPADFSMRRSISRLSRLDIGPRRVISPQHHRTKDKIDIVK